MGKGLLALAEGRFQDAAALFGAVAGAERTRLAECVAWGGVERWMACFLALMH